MGFAAAVFASSARAEVPNDQGQGVTVTSRAYTEKTYEHKAPALEVDGNGVVTDEAAWIGWHSGQNNENAEWVKLEGEKQLSSTSTDGTSPNTEYVKIIHQKKNQ